MTEVAETIDNGQSHTTVLKQEAVSALAVKADGFYVDATYGRGGHSRALLERLNTEGGLLVLDRDPEAAADAVTLAQRDARVTAVQASFKELEREVSRLGQAGRVQGVLFDLGLSSPQLETAARGFSFQRDGPLDMRMDPSQGESAADWINRAAEGDIADVLFRYGEERYARRMAKRLVAERRRQPITTTARLAEIVGAAHPAWERGRHPATKAFQAIRIHINGELEQIEQGLEQALSVLAPAGRLAVISFHSLEDRLAKRFIAAASRGDGYPRHLPVPQTMLQPKLKAVGRAVKPDAAETEHNPRARSAVMRVAEKL